MHTLTMFPQLLTFSLVSPVLLRLAIGLFIVFIGVGRVHGKYNWLCIFYFISSALLIVGLYTQLAAILGLIMLKLDFWLDKKSSHPTKETWALYILAGVILISLLFTGPGFLAFDWPL